MPDNRVIGVFDSGLGGLTTVRELIPRLPCEDIVYFGDTGRVPYGTRSRETIEKYAHQDFAFLSSFDPKIIVVACGTVSAAVLPYRAPGPIPVVGVLEPAARAAACATKDGRVGVLATESAISSGAYEKLLHALSPDIAVTARACPLLVPLVENGRFLPGDTVAETVVREYLEPLREAGVDTVILGCTHYPLLMPLMQAAMDVRYIDAGREVALFVSETLKEQDALTDRSGPGQRRYYVSDAPKKFTKLAEIFLQNSLDSEAEKIDIDNILC